MWCMGISVLSVTIKWKRSRESLESHSLNISSHSNDALSMKHTLYQTVTPVPNAVLACI